MAISFGKYENDSFKDYFLTDSTVFIAVNIIQVIVFYGKESTDFIDNLCQTKFNDWLGLFIGIAGVDNNSYKVFKKRKRNKIPS